jgi:hypothetical protein
MTLRRVVAATALAFTLFTPAPRAQQTPPTPAKPMTAEESDRQMRERLKLVTADRPNHPFLGTRTRDNLMKRLAELPADAPLDERLMLLDLVGYQWMVQADFVKAREYLERACQLAPRSKGHIDAKYRQLLLNLGTCFLRQGEIENCVACCNGESCIVPIAGGGVHTKQEGSKHALEIFLELLRIDPEDAAARWLANLAAMTLGTWPDAIPPKQRLPAELFKSEGDFPRFKNVACELGLANPDLCGGALAEDFDRDGDIDLVTCSWDPDERINYWRNDGAGKWVERGVEANFGGAAPLIGGQNMVSGDYDGDGLVDILVPRGAYCGTHGCQPRSLLKNLGDGKFVDVALAAGIADPALPSQTAAFADYDLDGDLDLYIGSENSPDVPAPCQLFRNKGDGTFEEVGAAAGVQNLRWAKSVTWGDVDHDRWPDLYVTNQGDENRLYHNKGDGTFEDVAAKAGVTKPIFGDPTFFFDYDNDGNLDLFVSCYEPRKWWNVSKSWLGLPNDGELPCLYKGDGKGGFTDVTKEMGLARVVMTMGHNFGDLDDDGWLDFYLGTGAPAYETLMPNLMFHNEKGRRFRDVTMAGGFGHLQKGHAVAFADFDGDGDLDVFEQMGGAYPGDHAGDALYQNPGFGNHRLVVELVGTRSNRSAIGTEIRADFVDGDGTKRSIFRDVRTGGSFGCNPLRQSLGVNQAKKIDRLDIFWPASNTHQVFNDVAVDRAVVITEGKDELAPLAGVAWK